MSTNQPRIELWIDIFEQSKQQAQALPTIMPSELVGAVLQEFEELPYLGDEPSRYQLCKAVDQTLLLPEVPLGDQVNTGEHLILQEYEVPLPNATTRPSRRLYLREPSTRKVFPIQWVPAIIGRKDADQPNNERIAVNLENFPTGLRVSRCHALITEEDGQFYVASLSDNPTALKPANGADSELHPVTTEKMTLAAGQRIHLTRSGIDLQIIVRDGDDVDA